MGDELELDPYEPCGYTPDTPGFGACTRQKDHDGPCAHQETHELIGVAETTLINQLEPGDILWVKVGMDIDQIGGDTPWIPTEEDMTYARTFWESAVPEGVTVVATHRGYELTIIKNTNVTSESDDAAV